MLRITAIGAGAVNYLLRGCDGLDHAHEMEARADSAELGADRYFARAMAAGEPAGMWLGTGWGALGLRAVEAEMHVGKGADEDMVRAIFAQLRRPESPENAPEFIGRRPHTYQGYDERLAKLQAAEPDASPERARAMEREARVGGNRAVAYYDFTFSPVKSISVLYASYLAAGLTEQAGAVRDAHDQAVKIALAYAEAHVAYTRRGGDAGREYIAGEGLAIVAFAHHTSREHEPQLHTHAAVLNRVATADGRVGALDGKGFRAFKEAITTAYERAVEQKVTAATGLRFVLRRDGVAREVAGMDPELLAEASSRRGQVTRRVGELVEQHRWRTGHEPSAAARKAMAQEATLSTRAAKTGLAGPKAVAGWVDRQAGRRARLASALADAQLMAGQSPVVVAASPRRVEAAMAAGLADVQARYATWQIGNLADAIDRHFGDAAALGVPAEQRAAALEALARRVLDPAEGFGVVQLSAREPVPVPPGLCRADGQPVWRPHEERRFATAAHLGTEAGVAASAARAGARALPEGTVLPWLERAGLSADQQAAVLGIMGSGCHGDVLIGPAGTGKSRTVGALAHAWGHTVGGTVYGVATAQIATTNLAGDGLTALNTTRFLAEVTPDPVTGQARRSLSADDLVVVDEASMVTTAHLAAISTAAARVGAKVVYVGDPHQLGAVEAGGLFAYLAETLPSAQVHALDEPHRFAHRWEAEASLWLRAGDQRAVEAYGDHGRLVAGTVEEMTAAARRGWLGDRLDGLDAVLVVGSNSTAADMSGELQAELIGLGRVRAEPLTVLGDENDARLGDVIEARRNAWDLRVDPSPAGVAEAVMNRGRYIVVGVGAEGAVLGRDRHGAIAHLPTEYLAEHAALGYACTVHGAEGVSVHAAHGVVDSDATREALYVQATRGGRHNYLYLVTEREPDVHEPQRLDEVAAERLAHILEVSGAAQAAVAVQAADETERTSAPVLLARLDHVTRQATAPHLATIRDRFGVDLDPDEESTERLVAALRAVELGGHDPAALLERAIASRGFDDVDSIAGVLSHRVRGAALAADPARDGDSLDWTARIGGRGNEELHGYARDLAAVVAARQAELGDRVATEEPPWARALRERPDPGLDPDAERAWRRGAGVAAFYREAAGIGPEQLSLGPAPSPQRPVQRALYDAALAATPNAHAQPAGRDWRTEPDAALYQARERWDRDLAQAPEWVAEEMAQTHRFARGYREDATIERARAESMPAGPQRDEVIQDAARAAGFAEHHEARATELHAVQQHRHGWWQDSEPVRLDAAAAMAELDRRGLPAERTVEEPRPATHSERDREPAREAALEPPVFQHEREARERAVATQDGQRLHPTRVEQHRAVLLEFTTELYPEVDRPGRTTAWSLDREMLFDDEVRARPQNLAQREGPEQTRGHEVGRNNEGPERGW